MSNDKNLSQLLNAVKEQLVKMTDSNHPAYRIILERDGYGLGQNGQPEVVAVHMKIEYLAAVVTLPVENRSSLVLPQNMRAAPPAAEPVDPPPVEAIVGDPDPAPAVDAPQI